MRASARYILPGLLLLALIAFVTFVVNEARKPSGALIRVVDEQGRPVAGAVITPDGLRPKKGGGHYAWHESLPVKPLPVTTDSAGEANVPYPRYVHEQMETGEISLQLEHPDYCADRPFVVVDVSPTSRDSLSAKLSFVFQRISHRQSPPTVTLKRGGVWVVSARTAAGQLVRSNLHVQTADWRLSFSTNGWRFAADGALECRRIPPGSNWFRVAYLPAQGETLFSDALLASAVAGQTNQFALTLRPGVHVLGKLDDTVPRPVTHGLIEAWAFAGGTNDGALTWTGWTNIAADGSFTLPTLPPGRLEFIALCDGFVSTNTQKGLTLGMQYPQAHTVAAGEFNLILPMEPTSVCRVKVPDDGGQPLRDATVAFWPNERWGDWSATLLAQARRSTEALLREGPSKERRVWGTGANDSPFTFHGKTDGQGVVEIRNLPGLPQRFAVEHPQFEMPIRKTSWGDKRREAETLLSPGTTNHVEVQMLKRGTKLLRN